MTRMILRAAPGKGLRKSWLLMRLILTVGSNENPGRRALVASLAIIFVTTSISKAEDGY